jgi:hypothetical protein
MTDPRPVTDADVASAWDALYETRVGDQTYPALPFDPCDTFHTYIRDGLRRVLETDRKRVAEGAV